MTEVKRLFYAMCQAEIMDLGVAYFRNPGPGHWPMLRTAAQASGVRVYPYEREPIHNLNV